MPGDLFAPVQSLLRGQGTLRAVENALDQGADANSWNGPLTPLRCAVQAHHLKLVQLLLKKNADANLGDQRGVNPLHMAVFDGKRDCAELLLDAGANVNAVDQHGQTPLFFAPTRQVCELLITKRADINVRNSKNQSPLHLAAHAGLNDTVTWFVDISNKDMLEAKDQKGHTPIYYAAHSKVKSTIGVLQKKGAEKPSRRLQPKTALEVAKQTSMERHTPEAKTSPPATAADTIPQAPESAQSVVAGQSEVFEEPPTAEQEQAFTAVTEFVQQATAEVVETDVRTESLEEIVAKSQPPPPAYVEEAPSMSPQSDVAAPRASEEPASDYQNTAETLEPEAAPPLAPSPPAPAKPEATDDIADQEEKVVPASDPPVACAAPNFEDEQATPPVLHASPTKAPDEEPESCLPQPAQTAVDESEPSSPPQAEAPLVEEPEASLTPLVPPLPDAANTEDVGKPAASDAQEEHPVMVEEASAPPAAATLEEAAPAPPQSEKPVQAEDARALSPPPEARTMPEQESVDMHESSAAEAIAAEEAASAAKKLAEDEAAAAANEAAAEAARKAEADAAEAAALKKAEEDAAAAAAKKAEEDAAADAAAKAKKAEEDAAAEAAAARQAEEEAAKVAAAAKKAEEEEAAAKKAAEEAAAKKAAEEAAAKKAEEDAAARKAEEEAAAAAAIAQKEADEEAAAAAARINEEDFAPPAPQSRELPQEDLETPMEAKAAVPVEEESTPPAPQASKLAQEEVALGEEEKAVAPVEEEAAPPAPQATKPSQEDVASREEEKATAPVEEEAAPPAPQASKPSQENVAPRDEEKTAAPVEEEASPPAPQASKPSQENVAPAEEEKATAPVEEEAAPPAPQASKPEQEDAALGEEEKATAPVEDEAAPPEPQASKPSQQDVAMEIDEKATAPVEEKAIIPEEPEASKPAQNETETPVETAVPEPQAEKLSHDLSQDHAASAQVPGANMPCTAWFYETPTGEVQGPFSVTRMRAWHAFGYFLPSLHVRLDWYQDFYQLKDLFPRLPRAFEDLPVHPKAETDRLPHVDLEMAAGSETHISQGTGSVARTTQPEIATSSAQASNAAASSSQPVSAQPQPSAESQPVDQSTPSPKAARREPEATAVEERSLQIPITNAAAVSSSSTAAAGAPAPDSPDQREDDYVVTPEEDADGCKFWEITLKKESVDDKFGFVQANGKLEFETRINSTSGSAGSHNANNNAANENAHRAMTPGPQVLIVRRIHENSLLHRWNRRHPEARVFPLDRICSVNGENTVEGMQREIRSQCIVLRFMRYPEHFTVKLKKDGRRLGFRFEFPQGAKAEEVRVTQLMKEGALPMHNTEQVSRAKWHYVVLPDMRIEAANDVHGNANQIAEELKACEEVTLRLRRAEHALLNSRHLQVRAQALAGFMGAHAGSSSGESNPGSPHSPTTSNVAFAANTPSPAAGGS